MRRPDFQIGPLGDPYLQRWYIIPRNRVFCVYLHRMLHDDDGRALHDHPGANVSVILRGGYDEVMFEWSPDEGYPLPSTIVRWRRPGRVVFRWARTAHRLALPAGVSESWSLFIMFPKLRDWGFWCGGLAARWVRWQDFTAGERGEFVGKGCG